MKIFNTLEIYYIRVYKISKNRLLFVDRTNAHNIFGKCLDRTSTRRSDILPFVHTCKHRLKGNTYFRITYILLHISASFDHHQVYVLLVNLLHFHSIMLYVNVL
jgi:hypothetical protein